LFLNGDCAGTQALCGMAFWDKISHPDSTKLPHTVQFSCGVMSRAMCSEHQLTDLMTWRTVLGMQSRLFQRTFSTEHGKSSNIVWMFSVLLNSPCGGLLKSIKDFQSYTMNYRKPHVASSICLRGIIFQNPEGTLWTHIHESCSNLFRLRCWNHCVLQKQNINKWNMASLRHCVYNSLSSRSNWG
jgi:hypothetical protein